MFMRVITRWQRCESIDAAGQGTKGTVTQMGNAQPLRNAGRAGDSFANRSSCGPYSF